MNGRSLHSFRGTGIAGGEARRGFALIITITLMAFLVLLLITVGTFTRVETEVAGYTQKQSVAREHARMGLEIALGELQKYAGRDDRVTARAEITGAADGVDPRVSQQVRDYWNERQPYWTGVWNVGNPDQVPVWLVSGNEHFPFDYATGTGDTGIYPAPGVYPQEYFVPRMTDGDFDADRLIELVSGGSAITADRAPGQSRIDGRVRVEKQPIRSERYPGLAQVSVSEGPPPEGGHVIGNYAWWVGDEGVKASLGLTDEAGFFHEGQVDDFTRFSADFYDPQLYDNPRSLELIQKNVAQRHGIEALWRLPWAGDFPFDPVQLYNHEPDHDAFVQQRGDGIHLNYDPLDPDWWRVLQPRQRLDVDDSSERDWLRWGQHHVTARTSGVLSTTIEGPNGYLLEDLSALIEADPGGSGFQRYGNYRADTSVDGSFSEANWSHPLGVVSPEAGLHPIITEVRLIVTLIFNDEGEIFHVSAFPQFTFWNPYNADLARTAYDIEIEGDLDLQLDFGILWRDEEDNEEFTHHRHDEPWNPFQPAGDMETTDAGFRLTTDEISLRAGEVVVLSGANLTKGLGGDPILITDQFANPFTPPPPGEDFAMEEVHLNVNAPGLEPGFQEAVYRVGLAMQETPYLEFSSLVLGDIDDAVFDDPASWGPIGDPELDATPGTIATRTNLRGNPQVAHSFAGRMVGADLTDDPAFLDRPLRADPRRYGELPREEKVAMGLLEDGNNFYEEPPRIETWDEEDLYGFFGVFSDSREGRFPVLFEVPRMPLTSLGQLSHASVAEQRAHALGDWDSPAYEDFDTVPPVSDLNAEWWNRYFLSSIPGNYNDETFRAPFPNPRMAVAETGDPPELADLVGNSGQAAAHLLNQGAFNVNSTSEYAWAALLNSFFNQDIAIWNPLEGEIEYLNTGESFGHGTQAGFGYEYGPAAAYSGNFEMTNGNRFYGSQFSRFYHAPGMNFYWREDVGDDAAGERSIWRNGFRMLHPLDLSDPRVEGPANFAEFSGADYLPGNYAVWEMARIIVEEIQERFDANAGRPFMSLAEFVNSGILQTAIDNVQWRNADRTGLNWYRSNGQWLEIPRSAPSYLSQGDLLAGLGSMLAVRSDTFVIRTYGDAHNPVTGEIEARAYLEATVQRVPEPVEPDDSRNIREDEYRDPPGNFGRKFEVISFRWLSPDEL